MGREVRKVPANWQHPRDERTGQFQTLYPGDRYASRKAEWLESLIAKGLQETLDYEGNPPDANDYMPAWADEEKTHFMMYEDTSEGTPISPAFATPEELAHWLADTGASSFGRDTATYEQWLKVAKGAWAPSMVLAGGKLQSGVEFTGAEK